MGIHRHLSGVFGALVAVTFTVGCGSTAPQSGPAAADLSTVQPAPAMETLVTAQWLRDHLNYPDLVVLDCSVHIGRNEDGSMLIESGRAGYETGHIPGAGFADLMGDLADGGAANHYALPTPEEFAAAMGALGVGDDTRVVLYDSSMSVWAARVWWMLRWIGFDGAALLDGGLGAWKAAGLPLSTDVADTQVEVLTVTVRPGLIADRDEVLAAIGDESVSIIDVMPEAHYRGEMSMYARPGHINGAANVPVMDLLDESGHYRSSAEMAGLFADDLGRRTITYCGGGIAASSTAFVLTRLGFTDVAVYIASLQEWAADPANPMETGPN